MMPASPALSFAQQLHLAGSSWLRTLAPGGHLSLLAAALLAGQQHGHLFAVLLHFGLVGFFLVAVVDSSFVPLPVPGVSDIMIIFFAASHTNLFLLVGLGTAGSALGGYLSFLIGQRGGVQFLEKHVPKRIFKRVTGWMESHAILAVALPAILPPPMPLSPFVLAAGALKMSVQRFMVAFTTSRLVRHIIAAWIGVRYGQAVLALWARFSSKWGATILIVIWTVILVFVGIAIWRLYATSKTLKKGKGGGAEKSGKEAALPKPAG